MLKAQLQKTQLKLLQLLKQVRYRLHFLSSLRMLHTVHCDAALMHVMVCQLY